MNKIDSIVADFAAVSPEKFSTVLGRAEVAEIAQVLDKLPAASAAPLAARLPASRIDGLLASREQSVERWLAEAALDDAISLLGRIPRERSLSLVNALANRRRRRQLLQYLKYPTHSVGSLVRHVALSFGANATVAEVVDELRGLDAAQSRMLVVVDADGNYLGTVDPWQLVTAHSQAGPIREYLSRPPALHPETSLVNTVLEPHWHKYNWLPVVENDHRVLGAVLREDVFAAAERESQQSGTGADFTAILVADLVGLVGAALERLLRKRGAS